MKIWLDDERKAPDFWYHFTNPDILMYLLEDRDFWNCIEEMSLDHDLGENLPTGYDVMKLIEELVVDRGFPLHFRLDVHSANPVGNKMMRIVRDRLVEFSQG